MKKITILTATRAEYGLLKTIIKKIIATDLLDVEVVVTGAHLSPEFGLTYKEIEQDQIPIARKIEILLSADSPAGISKSMGIAMISFADYFTQAKPDAILVLGDRYETLAVCCAAMNARIPIFHMYGGETTEGAVDEAIRHAITKMSYLHFTSTEEYRKRVIQLGEDPSRVFNVGAMGVENALHADLYSREELEENLQFSLENPYAVVTFHPVTLENSNVEEQCKELLKALDQRNDLNYIITKANADADGRIINALMEEYATSHNNVFLIDSLGMKRYLSAVKYSCMVIGNSSSGIVEVPSFNVPTVNIGDRQKGRLQAESVFNCKPDDFSILECINKAEMFTRKQMDISNPYGDGETSVKIVNEIIEYLLTDEIELKKSFYDLDFEY